MHLSHVARAPRPTGMGMARLHARGCNAARPLPSFVRGLLPCGLGIMMCNTTSAYGHVHPPEAAAEGRCARCVASARRHAKESRGRPPRSLLAGHLMAGKVDIHATAAGTAASAAGDDAKEGMAAAGELPAAARELEVQPVPFMKLFW